MAARKAESEDAIRQRRAQVAALYVAGETQAAIGKRIGVSQQQVSYDLQAIRAEWRASRILNFDRLVADELAKCDEVERRAWEQFERSCEDAVEVTTQVGGDRDGEETRKVKGQSGNPAYLAIIAKMIERRCKILGVDAPEEQNVTITDDLSPDERRSRLLAALGRRGDPAASRN